MIVLSRVIGRYTEFQEVPKNLRHLAQVSSEVTSKDERLRVAGSILYLELVSEPIKQTVKITCDREGRLQPKGNLFFEAIKGIKLNQS